MERAVAGSPDAIAEMITLATDLMFRYLVDRDDLKSLMNQQGLNGCQNQFIIIYDEHAPACLLPPFHRSPRTAHGRPSPRECGDLLG